MKSGRSTEQNTDVLNSLSKLQDHEVQIQEANDRAETLNLKGSTPKLKVGDRVSFFIPPTAEEADLTQ